MSTKYHSFISIFLKCLNLLPPEALFFNGFGYVNIRMEITFSFNPLDICIKHLDIWVNCFFLDPAVWYSEDVICQAHQVCILITLCTSVSDMTFSQLLCRLKPVSGPILKSWVSLHLRKRCEEKLTEQGNNILIMHCFPMIAGLYMVWCWSCIVWTCYLGFVSHEVFNIRKVS